MPSSRLDSHRNSVQNGMVERFTAFTATIFVPNFSFYVAATFCPLDGNCKNEQKTKKLREAGQGLGGPGPETGKGLKKGPETFLKISKTFQALFQGPCSETRAKIKKNQPEITKDQENLAKPSRNQGNDLGKTRKSKQK